MTTKSQFSSRVIPPSIFWTLLQGATRKKGRKKIGILLILFMEREAVERPLQQRLGRLVPICTPCLPQETPGRGSSCPPLHTQCRIGHCSKYIDYKRNVGGGMCENSERCRLKEVLFISKGTLCNKPHFEHKQHNVVGEKDGYWLKKSWQLAE